jgi:hypothetical protein
MPSKRSWQKIVKCNSWSDATINVHITESEMKKIDGVDGEVSYINPNRLGMDFDNFSGRSHEYIPNMSIADLIQLINRLELLGNQIIREALKSKTLQHRFGLELDSRRKLDFDIGTCPTSDEEEVIMHYADPLRNLDRFEIGRIDVRNVGKLIRVLKEAYIEYDQRILKSLLLREL